MVYHQWVLWRKRTIGIYAVLSLFVLLFTRNTFPGRSQQSWTFSKLTDRRIEDISTSILEYNVYLLIVSPQASICAHTICPPPFYPP
jgi:hypothetical protein